MQTKDRYPIGEQSFESLRKSHLKYVDKTKFLYSIVSEGSKYFFLARPRRFGKSLFLSTLQCFFEGKRDLFKGLFIDTANWHWEPYPVLRIDLNTKRYDEPGQLDSSLDVIFSEWEKEYGVTEKADNISDRFKLIIKAAHTKTGRQVVILVDEYDKPLVGNLNHDANLEYYRNRLSSLYANFKSSADHIRLVFLTGVSRFSKLSVFSDLNNLRDITFSPDYADICGITERELHENFESGIISLSERIDKSYTETCQLLKKNYDGYKFDKDGSDVYNPWSLLNTMAERKISDYWTLTGMPTIIAESLKKINANLEEFFDSYCTPLELNGFDLLNPNPQALLYQTGYLTIKAYDAEVDLYRLGIPNDKVERGLFTVMLPYYAHTQRDTIESIISKIISNLRLGRAENFMKELQAFFAAVSYKMQMDNENNFHNAFYLLTRLIGLNSEAEFATSDGSIDMTICTQRYIYIIELKYDGTPTAALEQIRNKKYARPFITDARQKILIGVNFSSQTRCIGSWLIESL